MIVEIEQFYRETDGDDWRPAALRAQHEWHARLAEPRAYRGFTLSFGPREYRFSGPLELIRGMRLIGAGGAGRYAGTILSFPPGSHGIVCHRETTAPAATPGLGDWSLVEGFHLHALGAGAAQAHGVVLHARMALRDIFISGFGGNGIHIEASSGAAPSTNANNWRVENCRVQGCGGDGLFVCGSDVNAGCATALDASGNGGWGVNDQSFLGNTYVACHTAANKQGAYTCQKPNARSLFLNCYSEGDQPASQLTWPSLVLGGFMAVEGSAVWLSAGGGVANFPNSVRGGDRAKPSQVAAFLGSPNMSGVALELHRTHPSTGIDVWPYRLHYGYQQRGWWELIYANLDGMAPLRFSTEAAAEGRGHLWLEDGYFLGRGNARVRIHTGMAPPTAGTWSKGDQILNAGPLPGDPTKGWAGWICVSAGTPGAWKPFGKIEP